ncbi:MAG TPA: DUF2282 domain-containing protein [Ideonella sp.]|nr:DUF2282 domain-containing protein [Ideonella sp.]
MNPRQITSSALAAALALGLGAPGAGAQDMMQGGADKEACYGVAKAGQNDCASLSGSHGCGGEAQVDNDPDEWKFVAKGTCKELRGMTAEEAKARLKGKAKAKT